MTQMFLVYSIRHQAWMTRNFTGTSEFSAAAEFDAASIERLKKSKDWQGNPEYIIIRREDNV